jgi:hypothetical protein
MTISTPRNSYHLYGMSLAVQMSKSGKPIRCSRILIVVRFVHALPGPGWTTSFPGEIFDLNATDNSTWGTDLGALDSTWTGNVFVSDEATFVEQQPAQGLIEDATARHVTNTCYGMVQDCNITGGLLAADIRTDLSDCCEVVW